MTDNIRDGVVFGCHRELGPGEAPDECVLDSPSYNGSDDCVHKGCHARIIVDLRMTKWNCEHWRPIPKTARKTEIVAYTVALIDGLKSQQDPNNINLIMELENCLVRHGICYKCGENFSVHNGDGSCVQD